MKFIYTIPVSHGGTDFSQHLASRRPGYANVFRQTERRYASLVRRYQIYCPKPFNQVVRLGFCIFLMVKKMKIRSQKCLRR
jgi:hypothetical protein